MLYRPGSVLAFSGYNFISDVINLMSYGIPRYSASHVGIIGGDSRTLYESKEETGVVSEPVEPFDYNGAIWYYELATPLRVMQRFALDEYLKSEVGKAYDARGAIRAGLWFWSLLNSRVHDETADALFCSEYVVRGLKLVGRFKTENTSRWSPNGFIREANRQGIFKPPIRLQ